MPKRCPIAQMFPTENALTRENTATRVEPPVRIELTTARLQDGSAYLRGYSRGFATAVKAPCGQGKCLRPCSRVSAGVVTLFTATCDNVVTPSGSKDFRQNAEGPGHGWHGALAAVVGPACDTHRNRMDAMNTARNIVLAVATVAALMVSAAGAAGADPTPSPSPGTKYLDRRGRCFRPPRSINRPAWWPRWRAG